MSGDISLGYWSQETSHSSYHHCNDDGIFDDESLGVPAGYGRRGFRSQYNSHSFSINYGLYRRSYQCSDNGRGEYGSQETSQSYSINRGASVYGDGRGGYR